MVDSAWEEIKPDIIISGFGKIDKIFKSIFL